VLVQVIAFGTTIFLNQNLLGSLLGGIILDNRLWSLMLLFIDGGFAAALCGLWGLPASWIAVNFLLPAGVLLSFNFPGWLISLALATTALIYIPTFWTRVPFYPTSRRTYDAVAGLLPADRPFEFIDLGCGFASMLCYLADRFPQGKFRGVEIGPLPWLVARVRTLGRKNLSVRYLSLWKVDLAPSDVVYTFLAPGPMEDVWKKVSKEMRKGGTFITNSFPPSRKADRSIVIQDGREFVLYIYAL
jgi:hypothetical protein